MRNLTRDKMVSYIRKLESDSEAEALTVLRFLRKEAGARNKNLAELIMDVLGVRQEQAVIAPPPSSEEFRRHYPSNQTAKAKKPPRTVLDALMAAADRGRDILTNDEYEFASMLPIELRFDWQMSEEWRRKARAIIRKVRSDGEEPLI